MNPASCQGPRLVAFNPRRRPSVSRLMEKIRRLERVEPVAADFIERLVDSAKKDRARKGGNQS